VFAAGAGWKDGGCADGCADDGHDDGWWKDPKNGCGVEGMALFFGDPRDGLKPKTICTLSPSQTVQALLFSTMVRANHSARIV
jgi:hypothetical protein